MRYFTFKTPYYALIKAIDSGRAIEIYDQSVATVEDKEAEEEVFQNMTEISESQAKTSYLKARLAEDGDEIPLEEQLSTFYEDSDELLLVDGSLL